MSGIFDQVLSYNPTVLASSLAGSVIYKGTWDAATNSPILANPPAATTKGWYYVVSVAGTQFGIDFAVGDWIISNGTVWQKVDLTDSVSSVFGRTGAIASANGDYTASQITNVPAGTISSTNVQDAINELSTDISTVQNVLDALVTNAESVAITKGQVVYAFGATGNRMSVKLALNTSDATSAKTIGVVLDSSIAAGTTGNIRIAGVVDGLNLGTFTAGDTLYLGATAGSVTSTKPYAPNHMVYVGIVERANNGNGQLYVRIQNGYELDEIHDVQITSAPDSGALLVRDATNSLWKAARLTAGTNIAVANADASVTVGVSGIIGSSNGGTGNGFTKFSGPTTSEKTFTLPDASATIHYEGGTIGATTANTGRFTTLTATSTISGSNLSGTNTGDQTISLTGDVTAAGSTGALTTTVGKINGVALIGLGTGILKNSTVTGQPGIAVPSDFPTLNQNTTGTASNVTGTVAVGNGGTGATTLTGYVKGSGTAALTASSTIPNTDVSGLGTMSTQAASSVAITGGSINNTTIGAATPNTGAFTTVTASTPIGTASGGTGVNTTPANGQVLIGNGTGYTANTLTAGSGITITNASGAITIASTGGSGAVISVSGTANEITSSPTTGAVVLSLPTALTFTGKTVTGGTFSSPTLTTPALGTPTSGVLTNATGLPLSTGVTGILTGTNGGTGVNNGANTITIAGNVTHAGAFTQSFTATANTALTLPTTGTLATLAGSEALSNKTITASSFSGSVAATTLSTSGDAGIGTASPTQRLQVSSSAGSTYALITNTSTGPSNLFLGAGNATTQLISRDATTGAVPISVIIGTTERANFSSTGLAVTGDVSSTGIISSTSSNQFPLRFSGATTNATAVQFTNTGGNSYFGAEGNATNNLIVGCTAYDTIVRGPSGIAFSANGGNNMQMRLSSTGLAITGTLSTLATNGVNVFESAGISSVGLQFKTNSTNRFKIETPSASNDLAFYAGGTTEVARLSSTGLAVTGNISTSNAGNNPSIKTTDGTVITKLQSLTVGDTAGWVGTESNNAFRIVTNNTARVTVDTSGNVGIGTSSPGTTLDVQAANASLRVYGTGASDSPQFQLRNGSQIWQQIVDGADSNKWKLRTGAGTSVLTCDTSGNVGIGATSPSSTFQVNGTSTFETGGFASLPALRMITDSDNPSLRFYRPSGGSPNSNIWQLQGNGSDFIIGSTVANRYSETSFNQRLKIDISGNVTISTLGTGLVYSNAGVLTSTNPSDARLKTDITDIGYGLSSIIALRPVSYKWKSDIVNQGTQFGFIAQEVQTIMPDLVKEFETTENGETVTRLGLEKEGIYAALVKAVQELNGLNANLVAQVAALSQRVAALESN